VAIALVVGTLVGIAATTRASLRFRAGAQPAGAALRDVPGSPHSGIGFAVSLVITGLAFESRELQDLAKGGDLRRLDPKRAARRRPARSPRAPTRRRAPERGLH
jgi:Na+/H+ antiporter NhaA